jgi:hypothetical protein
MLAGSLDKSKTHNLKGVVCTPMTTNSFRAEFSFPRNYIIIFLQVKLMQYRKPTSMVLLDY